MPTYNGSPKTNLDYVKILLVRDGTTYGKSAYADKSFRIDKFNIESLWLRTRNNSAQSALAEYSILSQLNYRNAVKFVNTAYSAICNRFEIHYVTRLLCYQIY